MAAALYVLGHRNPDSDSICSAIGYATLLRLQGRPEAIAARQGVLRRETAAILRRFGVPAPVLVTDVRPRVSDVMTSPAVHVHQDSSLLEVGHAMQSRGLRAIPVVDAAGRLLGATSVEDFARVFIEGLDLDSLDRVPLELDNVVRALGGRVLVEAPGRRLRDRVLVGAMEIDSMVKRIEPDILMVLGDRKDAQHAAIAYGIGALVITGDHPVDPEIIAMAHQHQVTIIAVPHHTYTTVRLIHLSAPVRHVMRTDVPTCAPDDLLDDVREVLQGGATTSLIVVDGDRKVVGIVSRSDLLRPVRHQVVLVDHNESGQSVAGIEEADVVGVVDHHRVANFQTRTPPFMRLEPVGSTCTIVAKLFTEAHVAMPMEVAGVLLSGILADTLLFRGPTTTAEDRRVAAELADYAGLDTNDLGMSILTLASDVSERTVEQLLMGDFKDFSVDGSHFGVGVIETTNGGDVLARRDELLVAMARLRQDGYTSVWFAVIDILREQTTVLIDGYADEVAAAFDVPLRDAHTLHLPGIISRKKQLVPQLSAISRRIAAR